MQRFDIRLSSIQSLHDEIVMALLCSKQLHLSIETILDSIFRRCDDLSQEKITIKVRYFFMNIACVQSS